MNFNTVVSCSYPVSLHIQTYWLTLAATLKDPPLCPHTVHVWYNSQTEQRLHLLKNTTRLAFVMDDEDALCEV